MAIVRNLARRGLYAAMGSGPAVARRLSAIRRAGKATILNLHRVGELDGSAYQPLSPRLFEDLLDFLQRHFSLVPLGELAGPSPRPKAVLSFDDGYKDFFEVAAPILERRGIRSNLNVIPACIESGLPPFNVLAQDFLGKAPPELVERLDLPGFERGSGSGAGTGMRLSAFLKNRCREEQREIEGSLIPQFFAWEGFRPTPMMTMDEVRAAARRHDIGAHSFEHATMGFESDAYFEADLERCCAYFETELGRKMTIYAFPNGSYRESQISLARKAGIEHLLLVGEDFSEGGAVHKRFTFAARSRAEARFRALGALRRVA